MERENRDGFDERSTKIMMDMPITKLSRYIGAKWYLPLEQLAEKSGVPFQTIQNAIYGKDILPRHEKRIRAFLEKL